jgi:hypothetical protein
LRALARDLAALARALEALAGPDGNDNGDGEIRPTSPLMKGDLS